jgi:undecaprenyl-diphosphatase
MENIEAFNQSLFLMINATPATPAWLIDTALFFANYVILMVPVVLVAMWLAGDARQRELAIRVCAVTFLALGANQLIGLAWPHPRPFVIGLGHTFLDHAPDPSFPSDHGTVFASFVLTLLLGGMMRTGCIALVAGVAVAWARIFLGVHYPLDMLGALTVSCVAWVVIVPVWKAGGPAITRLAVTLYRVLFARPISLGWLRR